MTRKLQSPDAPASRAGNAPRPRGSLTHDGSWNRFIETATAVEKYVAELCRVRHAAQVPPCTIAERIRSGPFTDAFPSVMAGEWDRWTDWRLWPLVRCATSAECVVKYRGYSNAHGHWQGGDWCPGPDTRHHPVPSPDHARALVTGVLAARGY